MGDRFPRGPEIVKVLVYVRVVEVVIAIMLPCGVGWWRIFLLVPATRVSQLGIIRTRILTLDASRTTSIDD